MENDFQVSIKQPVIITGNFEEMKAELSNMMTAYAGLEVTEENLPERKKDVATLRKIKTAFKCARAVVRKSVEQIQMGAAKPSASGFPVVGTYKPFFNRNSISVRSKFQ